MEFSPRKAAGDLDFCGGALLEGVVMSESDALMSHRLKASEAPSVGRIRNPCWWDCVMIFNLNYEMEYYVGKYKDGMKQNHFMTVMFQLVFFLPEDDSI